MTAKTLSRARSKLQDFLETHLEGLENDERIEALGWYCQGLGLELPDKTVFSIGARLGPESIEGTRQRIQRALQKGRFSHWDVFCRLQRTLFEQGRKAFDAYAFDDTGIEKKGEHSVGVQRQYSGTLGKRGNCQVIVTLHGISDTAGFCLDAQLYMPEGWTDDRERMDTAGVPADLEFRTKPEIALEMLQRARKNGAPKRVVVADAGYGDSSEFRDGIRDLDLDYAVAVSSNAKVWFPGTKLAAPPRTREGGRAPSRHQALDGSEPIQLDKLAKQIWGTTHKPKMILWRQGTKGTLDGEFITLRVQSAERRHRGKEPSDLQWLVISPDKTKECGFRFYLSSLPASTPLIQLIRLCKVRWRIERDYQDMKQYLGFDRYEGRQWGGLHRHLAMVALMFAFLSLYRESFSPEGHDDLEMGGFLPLDFDGASPLGGALSNLPTQTRS